jgi:hypothetical protein
MKYGDQRFTVNSPGVVHDTFDGEAVIINLESGNYYSLQYSAEYLWNRLASGVNVSRLIAELAEYYSMEPADVEAFLEPFIGQLLEEDLLREVAADDSNIGEKDPDRNALMPARFEEPVLNCFTDMQELLLLDPIHEVDDMGWPTRPKEDASQ